MRSFVFICIVLLSSFSFAEDKIVQFQDEDLKVEKAKDLEIDKNSQKEVEDFKIEKEKFNEFIFLDFNEKLKDSSLS